MTVPTRLVMAGGALGFNWLPVHVAKRHGFFERRGLDVELVRTGSVDKATEAVRSGQAQLAITPPEGALNDYVNAGELEIVAGNVNRLPLTLIAQPRFKRIEDLKGQRLGTSSLTEGTAIYTMEMLARHGLRYPGDYTFSVIGVHPARWKALQEGTIEAAVQLVPLNFVAIDAGYSNLGEVSDYIPEIAFTALIGRKAWLAENTATVVALLQAVREATAWLYDPANDEALLPLVSEVSQAEGKYARIALDYMRQMQVFAKSLEIPAAALAKSVELMVKANLLDAAHLQSALGAFSGNLRSKALARTS
jgi:ABC-type nitrate/sulfonate/bicarbonate transport system substrate-binding protein